ncbi:hypothetical protein QBC44DRAFT_302744 [Cladorrhinum sp. PSN332]|nr:hypothetical protein QBC44DRAFT_302744 [Cladorrhinum sp. PSN332]
MESQSERIIGSETPGMAPQMLDETRASYGTISVAPVMSAQMELVTATQILQPLKEKVSEKAPSAIDQKERSEVVDVYLSCSTRYVYDKFIEELRYGARAMIYHFHYCNKGQHPFAPGWTDSPENVTMAQLNEEQVKFLQDSVRMINRRMPEFKRIRENNVFEHDWYFVSQLYETDWQPRFTV